MCHRDRLFFSRSLFVYFALLRGKAVGRLYGKTLKHCEFQNFAFFFYQPVLY
jgi:hypothetical protein